MTAWHLTDFTIDLLIYNKRIPVLHYKRPMGKKVFFRPYEYFLDKYYDCVICPEDHVLNYATASRDGYREYKSNTYIKTKIGGIL